MTELRLVACMVNVVYVGHVFIGGAPSILSAALSALGMSLTAFALLPLAVR